QIRRNPVLLAVMLCAGLLTLPTLAFAGPLSGGHDSGFVMRATIGPSFARMGQKLNSEDAHYNLQGASLNADLALGFALSEHFAVHATAAYWNMFNPTLKASIGD